MGHCSVDWLDLELDFSHWQGACGKWLGRLITIIKRQMKMFAMFCQNRA